MTNNNPVSTSAGAVRAIELRESDAQAAAAMRTLAFSLARFYGIGRCCVDCDHWGDDKTGCNMWAVMPPPSVIAKGCDSFEEAIPF